MANIVSGSCLCNGVTFDVVGLPENCIQCYCRHCMKNAGAPSQLCAKFKKEQIRIKEGTDLLKVFVLTDTVSGHDKHKVFCNTCGCTLWTIPMRHGGNHFIVRTSLIENGLTLFPPQVVFFASRCPSDSEKQQSLKSFPTMPGF